MQNLSRPAIVLAQCGALCCALLPGTASAAPWAGILPLGPLVAAAAALAPAAPVAARDDRLEQMRGGSDTPWSDMKLGGTVANNSAINVVSGANIITDNAFSNASGMPTVIQNSGANVLIQNATIINVQVK